MVWRDGWYHTAHTHSSFDMHHRAMCHFVHLIIGVVSDAVGTDEAKRKYTICVSVSSDLCVRECK